MAIIVGIKKISGDENKYFVVTDDDGRFMCDGKILSFEDAISCMALSSAIYTTYGDDYKYARMVSAYERDAIFSKSKNVLSSGDVYVKNALYLKNIIRGGNSNKYIIFYNDESELHINANFDEEIAALNKAHDENIKQLYDQYVLCSNECDYKGEEEIKEKMYLALDDYVDAWRNSEKLSLLSKSIDQKEWEVYARNYIPRRTSVQSFFGSYGKIVEDNYDFFIAHMPELWNRQHGYDFYRDAYAQELIAKWCEGYEKDDPLFKLFHS